MTTGETAQQIYRRAHDCRAKGDLAQAAILFREALRLRPDFAAAAIDLATLHQQFQDLDSAIALYRHALVADPQSAQALCNLALALQGLRRFDEALAAFDAAMAIAPKAPLVRLNRAQLLLMLGRWDEGWEEYEWRWRLPRRKRTPYAPGWDGSPLRGRTLLVFFELGLGDTIQMLRYLPLVAERATGGRVLVACQAPFRRLMSGIPGIELISEGDALPRLDFEVPMSSLPRIFGTRPDTVPPQPVLRFPADDMAPALVRTAPGPRVGLVWAGNPGMLNDATRSMPLDTLRPLTGVKPSGLFSLQKGEAAEAQLAATGLDAAIVPLGPHLHDMADTAAAIREMDLVVTVCTSVAHLAGTLGKPTWLMLSYASEWRWMLNRDDTPWYPSMRIFRQDKRGDWDGVVARIAAALAEWPANPIGH